MNDSPMFKYIGLCGAAGSGKDLAAVYIGKHFGHDRFALADAMKIGLTRMLELETDWILSDKEQPIDWLGVSPRRLLQTLGTEWGRDTIRPDIWIRVLERTIKKASPRRVVVTDIRFHNEADWLRSKGGVLLRVVRPDAPRVETHKSETFALESRHDAVVINHGTKLDLEINVVSALQELWDKYNAEYAA